MRAACCCRTRPTRAQAPGRPRRPRWPRCCGRTECDPTSSARTVPGRRTGIQHIIYHFVNNEITYLLQNLGVFEDLMHVLDQRRWVKRAAPVPADGDGASAAGDSDLVSGLSLLYCSDELIDSLLPKSDTLECHFCLYFILYLQSNLYNLCVPLSTGWLWGRLQLGGIKYLIFTFTRSCSLCLPCHCLPVNLMFFN